MRPDPGVPIPPLDLTIIVGQKNDEIKDLRAKLEIAVKALERYADLGNWDKEVGKTPFGERTVTVSWVGMKSGVPWAYADKALEEIRGKK